MISEDTIAAVSTPPGRGGIGIVRLSGERAVEIARGLIHSGDHPLNLLSSTLALNAYMLQHEGKYRKWLLEYIDAWLARMEKNGDVIPSNVGLDGTIGGACDGKWYGGTYGWGFSVTVPQTGEIAQHQ